MKPWKVRQQLTHRLHEHDDLIEDTDVRVWNKDDFRPIDFAHDVFGYFVQEGDGTLHYPQKSYAVAIIYAKLLEKHFGENFIAVLNDPELLLSDKFFMPYSEDPETYDSVISMLTYWNNWDFESNPISSVQATVRYFKKEFMLD